MGFDDALEKILRDTRSQEVPILYIVHILLICDDLRLFKDV